jgi:hypothetical protein
VSIGGRDPKYPGLPPDYFRKEYPMLRQGQTADDTDLCNDCGHVRWRHARNGLIGSVCFVMHCRCTTRGEFRTLIPGRGYWP